MNQKSLMTLKDLKLAKAELVAKMTNSCALIDAKSIQQTAPTNDLTKPGFYFFVHPSRQEVYSRYFVGRQRSKTGVQNIVSKIRNKNSKTSDILTGAHTTFEIYYISLDNLKVLTTGHGKGKIALAFTRKHSGEYQNLDELNRLLNDNFKFKAQKY